MILKINPKAGYEKYSYSVRTLENIDQESEKESRNRNSRAAFRTSVFKETKKQAETFDLFFSFIRQPKNLKMCKKYWFNKRYCKMKKEGGMSGINR
jgi:hypothetical protein